MPYRRKSARSSPAAFSTTFRMDARQLVDRRNVVPFEIRTPAFVSIP